MKDLISKVYEKSIIQCKDVLNANMINKALYRNEYAAITAWYLTVRRENSTHPLFRNRISFNPDEAAIILEHLVILDDYRIEQVILALNHLCIDSWWKNISSAFSFKRFRKIKNNSSLFDKIYADFERKNDRLIRSIKKEIDDERRVLNQYM